MSQNNPITGMQVGILIPVIMACMLAAAGCVYLPGVHILGNTPDPIIGQWIGGELPASDLHVIFFENQTYFSRSFYLNQGEKTEGGKLEPKGQRAFHHAISHREYHRAGFMILRMIRST